MTPEARLTELRHRLMRLFAGANTMKLFDDHARWVRGVLDESAARRAERERCKRQISEALALLHGIDYDEGSRVDRAVATLEGVEPRAEADGLSPVKEKIPPTPHDRG